MSCRATQDGRIIAESSDKMWSTGGGNGKPPQYTCCDSLWILPVLPCKRMHGQCWNQTDYILCSRRWRSYIQSAKTRPGSDCSSDHQLLIAKFRLKAKKVGKTTRPARYDLTQIPYEYAVEVTNRLKGLELINSVPEELWSVIPYGRQQTKPSWIKRQEGTVVIWGSLTNS